MTFNEKNEVTLLLLMRF